MTQRPIDADAFRDFERAAHDEIADGYRNFFTAVTEYAVEPLLDAAAVGPGVRVLDVATGPGVLAFRAANRGATSVIGVDLSPQMIRLAAAAYEGVEFRQADAGACPPPELPTGPPMFRFSDKQELSAALHSVGLAEVGVRAFPSIIP